MGKDNQFAFFPSAALGWRISEEKFMKRFTKLNNLKVRLSYGLSGNRGYCPVSDLASDETAECHVRRNSANRLRPRPFG
ncbi:hypothetical protein NXV73_09770 [Bacteroides salyersiae]|nr:hypothetical protein [Bacteroides salyersiae]